jgi:hypothetical protein
MHYAQSIPMLRGINLSEALARMRRVLQLKDFSAGI